MAQPMSRAEDRFPTERDWIDSFGYRIFLTTGADDDYCAAEQLYAQMLGLDEDVE